MKCFLDRELADYSDDGFLDRFRLVLQRVGQLQRAADLSEYSSEQIAKWRDGKARPPFKPMAILASAAGVSLDWLANGDGPASTAAILPSQPGEDADTVHLPLMNVVGAAGNGIENHEVEVINRLPFSLALLKQLGVRPDSAQFIRCQVDSMLPTLADGGICLIDTSRTRARDGGIYAVMVGEDVLIKRLQLGARGLTLISDNAEKYPPETLEGDEIGRVKVIGKVFWAGGGM
jgi:phage repressor protein C with HTH and peptisase S24 domain